MSSDREWDSARQQWVWPDEAQPPWPRSVSDCHEEVSRKGELQPCDKPAVAVRIDEEGGPYPVCARHARAPMVSLAQLRGDV